MGEFSDHVEWQAGDDRDRIKGTSAPGQLASVIDSIAAIAALVLCPAAVTPTAAGTCWRKMIIPMPTVKPSMTGHGM